MRMSESIVPMCVDMRAGRLDTNFLNRLEIKFRWEMVCNCLDLLYTDMLS